MDPACGPSQVPLVILAGSDRRPGPVPAGAEGYHFVVGYKGAELRLGRRPLIELLLESARKSAAFGEIYVAGPARVYGPLVDCPLVDTDRSVSTNIRRAVAMVRSRHGRATPIAFMSCDVFPSAAEIAELAGEMLAASATAALTLSLVTAPEELGASRWKPRYSIRPAAGAEPVPFLPGHLVIARPSGLRMGLFHRLVQLAYKERNRDYDERRRYILARLVRSLLWRDLLNLLRLKPPSLTYSVLRSGLGAFLGWRRGELDVEGLARAIAGVLVRRRYYRRHGAASVRIVTTPLMAFARDIDTREELEEILAARREICPRGE